VYKPNASITANLQSITTQDYLANSPSWNYVLSPPLVSLPSLLPEGHGEMVLNRMENVLK